MTRDRNLREKKPQKKHKNHGGTHNLSDEEFRHRQRVRLEFYFKHEPQSPLEFSHTDFIKALNTLAIDNPKCQIFLDECCLSPRKNRELSNLSDAYYHALAGLDDPKTLPGFQTIHRIFGEYAIALDQVLQHENVAVIPAVARGFEKYKEKTIRRMRLLRSAHHHEEDVLAPIEQLLTSLRKNSERYKDIEDRPLAVKFASHLQNIPRKKSATPVTEVTNTLLACGFAHAIHSKGTSIISTLPSNYYPADILMQSVRDSLDTHLATNGKPFEGNFCVTLGQLSWNNPAGQHYFKEGRNYLLYS